MVAKTDWATGDTVTAASMNTLGGEVNTKYGAGGTDVGIADGGTGASTLPAGLLVGAGTSAITAKAAPGGAVVGTSDTQTLTNKTLTAPTLTSPILTNAVLGTPISGTLTACTGLVPSSGLAATGTPSSTTYLRGDNTWATGAGGGSGTVTPSSTDTFTNKTVNLTSNTLSMTKAQLNAAISDGDAYVTGGTDVPIADGGTGVSTLPAGLLKGAGTGPIVAATPGTDFVAPGGALATPTSGTLTNCTGLPVAGIAASTSAVLGVGTLELGAATDTTLSRIAAGQIAVEGVAVPTISSTHTLTNKKITARSSTVTSSATPTINTDLVDMFGITGLTVDITSMTTNISGTNTDGQMLWIYFVGVGPVRTITWGSMFEAGAAKLPLSVGNTRLDVALVWNAATGKWRCMDSSEPYPAFTTITSSATPAINTDLYDAFSITALAVTITSMTTNLTGTPRNFQKLMIRIKDNGTFRPISWGTAFQDGATSLPTTTVANKTLLTGLVYDSGDAKWTCEASGSRA